MTWRCTMVAVQCSLELELVIMSALETNCVCVSLVVEPACGGFQYTNYFTRI